MSTANNPGIDLDLMAAAAQTRLAAFINRTAAQQMRRMREGWTDAAAIAPTPTQTNHAVPMPPRVQPFTPEPPYPWDDITAIGADDTDELSTFNLVGMALQVATVVAFIFCAGFSLGYLTSAR
jgi:hypothetical protein